MIHIVMGLPGCGKTETAKYLEGRLSGVRVNTDDIYTHLYPDNRYVGGVFLPGRLEQVYNTLGVLAFYLEQADPHRDYIFEGSFRYRAQHGLIQSQFEDRSKVKTILVEITDEKEVERRIVKRQAEGNPGTYEGYLKVKKAFERPRNDEIFVIDNSGSLENLNQRVNLYVNSLERR